MSALNVSNISMHRVTSSVHSSLEQSIQRNIMVSISPRISSGYSKEIASLAKTKAETDSEVLIAEVNPLSSRMSIDVPGARYAHSITIGSQYNLETKNKQEAFGSPTSFIFIKNLLLVKIKSLLGSFWKYVSDPDPISTLTIIILSNGIPLPGVSWAGISREIQVHIQEQ